MKHDTLGQIEWSSSRHGWYTTEEFEIDFFRRCGIHLPKDPEGGPGRGGRVDVGFSVDDDGDYEQYDGRRRQQPPKPTKVQFAAWQALSDAGDPVWSDLAHSLLAEYQRQRPARVRWWEAAFAHCNIDFVLPDVRDEQAVLKHVHPHEIRIKRHATDERTAEIEVGFAATWIENGFKAVIQDGRFVGLREGSLTHVGEAAAGEYDHPITGCLTRERTDKPWQGVVRSETFARFIMVAGERAAFRRTGKSSGGDEPECSMSWHAARDEFELRVHAPEGQPPTARQSDAIARFGSDVEVHAAAVLDAVLAHYRKRWKAFRKAWDGPDIDALIPEPPETVDGLVELMELREIHVLPDEGKTRHVTIGLQFKCDWDSETFGFGVLWRDGQVAEVCAEDDAVIY